MGAWSHDNFGSDTALDFLGDVEQYGELAIATVIQATLKTRKDDMVAAHQATKTLAAAELVAISLGRTPENIPQNVPQILNKVGDISRHRIGAIRASKQILSSSELRDLWFETDDFSAWKDVMDDLIRRLRGQT